MDQDVKIIEWAKMCEDIDNGGYKDLCDVDTLIKRLKVVLAKSSNPSIKWISKDENGYPQIVYSVGAGAYDSVSLAK